MKRLLLGLVAWIMTIGLAFGAVNINTATKEQLDSLKGIGPTKAQAIIDYRAKHGPFKSIEDLEKVPGIGPATMKEIRSDISVSGATTIPAKKDETKGSARAEQKATKKSEEKKKADGKPAPKKEDAKAPVKGSDKAAPKKDEAKAPANVDDKAAAKKDAAKTTTETKEKSDKK